MNNQNQSRRTAGVAFLLLFTTFLYIGCDKDDTAPKKSREVRFELTGNFSGTLEVTYTTASGGATNESVPGLPWTKSITYQSTAQGATITIGGRGGAAGQTLVVKVFAGSVMVSETSSVASSAGIVVVAAPTYIF